jgi:hypothetical protein
MLRPLISSRRDRHRLGFWPWEAWVKGLIGGLHHNAKFINHDLCGLSRVVRLRMYVCMYVCMGSIKCVYVCMYVGMHVCS